MAERVFTIVDMIVILIKATSSGFISGEVGTSAALDAFSTVYEVPLTRFEIRQTNKQTN